MGTQANLNHMGTRGGISERKNNTKMFFCRLYVKVFLPKHFYPGIQSTLKEEGAPSMLGTLTPTPTSRFLSCLPPAHPCAPGRPGPEAAEQRGLGGPWSPQPLPRDKPGQPQGDNRHTKTNSKFYYKL